MVEEAAAAAATAARRALGPYASEEECLVEALRRFGDDAEAAVAATSEVGQYERNTMDTLNVAPHYRPSVLESSGILCRAKQLMLDTSSTTL